MRLGARQRSDTQCEIQPLLGSALPEMARFLHGWQADRDPDGSLDRRLHWLLVENPLTPDAAGPYGLCIRSASGGILGLLLSFPSAFLAGDQRLLGLCSSSFFVDAPARTLGFYLFKQYLNAPGYSFFFSTTCNANSAALWKAVGAGAVAQSDREYILPLKLDVMLPAALTGRTSRASAAAVARVVGRLANPVLQWLTRTSPRLTSESCRDWEKLAALFRRHRPADGITTDRSAALLQWRYGERSPNQPFDIYVVRDERGNEGWFSLGTIVRGRQGQIRGCVLLDAVWPRDKLSFPEILSAILPLAASRADALFLSPRPGLDYGEGSRWIIPCRLAAPHVFAVTRKDGPPVAVSSLDLVPADGDGAF
jgi:hypothetical protein